MVGTIYCIRRAKQTGCLSRTGPTAAGLQAPADGQPASACEPAQGGHHVLPSGGDPAVSHALRHRPHPVRLRMGQGRAHWRSLSRLGEPFLLLV